jgi:DNA-binding IscR family transcriptional regulator
VSLSNREKERLALNLMLLVARHRAQGQTPMTLTELAQAAGLPPLAMAAVYETLEAAGLIELGRREEVSLARDAADIRLAEILRAVRHRRRGHRLLHVAARPVIAHLELKIEAAVEGCVAQATLADLTADDASAVS